MANQLSRICRGQNNLGYNASHTRDKKATAPLREAEKQVAESGQGSQEKAGKTPLRESKEKPKIASYITAKADPKVTQAQRAHGSAAELHS